MIGERIRPAVVFKRAEEKREIVKWDGLEALKLWRGRGPYASTSLPPLFDSVSEVTEVPKGIVGRDRLVLKSRSVEELMNYTRDDE